MVEWKDYRMWRRAPCGVVNGGSSAMWLGEWKPTNIFFRARSQAEAQKKADKMWRECQWGPGSMLCIPANEQPAMNDF
jgi:hypothetical protein